MQPLIDGDIHPSWLDWREYFDGYWVSRDGQVYSDHSKRLLKGYYTPLGYKYYTFKSGKREYAHRLVGFCFLKTELGKNEINHLDGDPRNNDMDNLQWCTASENIQHSHDFLSRKKIQSYHHPNRTLSDKDILEIFHSEEPQRIIAERYGTSARTVFNIRKGIRHSRVTGKEVVCPTVNR